ncbi:MAG: hypothetical protein JXR35_02370 [Rhodobacteraceae bacterium]|nr:hypothetical protein [Paracoccaceae bacterium]
MQLQILAESGSGRLGFDLTDDWRARTTNLGLNRREGEVSVNGLHTVILPVPGELILRMNSRAGHAGLREIERVQPDIDFLWHGRNSVRFSLPLVVAKR